MFIKNISGKEKINELAKSLGMEAGEAVFKAGRGRPGLIGNTFAHKEKIKALGAKFDGSEKAWTFDSWEALESALKNIKGA